MDVEYRNVGQTESARLVVRSMQLDNQLLTSNHPVVFAHAVRPPQLVHTEGVASGPKPILEVAVGKINRNPGLEHVQYFNFLLQEVDLVLEENMLDLVSLGFLV